MMTADQQAEYDAVLAAGSSFVGGKKKGFYIPTIQLNNSDKTYKKTGVPIGNFFLKEKKGEEEIVTDMSLALSGIILKVSYSIKSIFDPAGNVYFYSQEFDNFFEDTVTVRNGKLKYSDPNSIKFEGSYKDWKEANQVRSSRGTSNDFELNVHLYFVMNGELDDPKVYRLTFKGRSMSEWFTYTNGNKEKGIESIYSQGLAPHSAIHNFTSADDVTPKGEAYYYIAFSPEYKLNLDSLKKVIVLQKELDAQLRSLRGGSKIEEVQEAPQARRLATPDTSEVKDHEIVGGKREDEDDEVRLENVPF